MSLQDHDMDLLRIEWLDTQTGKRHYNEMLNQYTEEDSIKYFHRFDDIFSSLLNAYLQSQLAIKKVSDDLGALARSESGWEGLKAQDIAIKQSFSKLLDEAMKQQNLSVSAIAYTVICSLTAAKNRGVLENNDAAMMYRWWQPLNFMMKGLHADDGNYNIDLTEGFGLAKEVITEKTPDQLVKLSRIVFSYIASSRVSLENENCSTLVDYMQERTKLCTELALTMDFLTHLSIIKMFGQVESWIPPMWDNETLLIEGHGRGSNTKRWKTIVTISNEVGYERLVEMSKQSLRETLSHTFFDDICSDSFINNITNNTGKNGASAFIP